MVLYDLRSLPANKNIHLSDAEHSDNCGFNVVFSCTCINSDKVIMVSSSIDQVTIKTRKKTFICNY